MSAKKTNTIVVSVRILGVALSACVLIVLGGCETVSMTGGNPLQVEQNYNFAKGAKDRASQALALASAQTCEGAAEFRTAAQSAHDLASQSLANTEANRTAFQEKYAALQNLKAMAPEFTEARSAWLGARSDYDRAIEEARDLRKEVADGNTAAVLPGRQALDDAIAAIEDMRSTKSRLASAVTSLATNYSGYRDFVDPEEDWAEDISQANLNATAQAWRDSVGRINDALLQEAKDELSEARNKFNDARYNLLNPFGLHTTTSGHISDARRMVADLYGDPSYGEDAMDGDDDLDLTASELGTAVFKMIERGEGAVTRAELDVVGATDEVTDAASEANRNAILAYQACHDGELPPGVDPDDLAGMDLENPFDNRGNPYPSWNSTFWDISSP